MARKSAHTPPIPRQKIILVACYVLALTMIVLARLYANKDGNVSTRSVAQLNIATVWILGILHWPILWQTLVGYQMLSEFPLTLCGFAWPFILICLDLIWIPHQTIEHEGVNKKTIFHFDAGAVQALSFGIGGLLLTQIGRNFARTTSPIFSACIFMCVAFLLPTPGVQALSVTGVTVSAIQKLQRFDREKEGSSLTLACSP